MNPPTRNSAVSKVLPLVESRTVEFLEALASGGGKPLEQLPASEARAVLVDAQAGVGVDLPACEESEKTIEVGGRSIVLTIVSPAEATGILPAFLFFHGGGWVLGDFPTHRRLVRDLVSKSEAVAVFVNYTPSPEARYPVAIEEAYAATHWVAEHGAEIGVDGSRLAVVGNSVGGNMAAVVSLMALERSGPSIRFQALLWPVTDSNFETESYDDFAEGHFLTRNMMKWFWDNYTPDPEQRGESHASPLRATKKQLQGLPPTLIVTAECDVLRDEGEAFARALDAAGVEVTSTRYNGMIHDFGLLNAIARIPGTKSALLQISTELRERLR